MKASFCVALLALFFLCEGFAQGTIRVTTDKPTYSYGEPIQVRVSVSNTTDSTFSLWGSSSCIAFIRFNDAPCTMICTADHAEFRFTPGTTRTWIWNLVPSEHGIPDKEGTQTICGIVAGMIDSLHVQAPRFYGGQMSVGVKSGVTQSEMQSLRDSVGATVISSTVTGEHWQVVGHSIDSIRAAYAQDYRLRWIQVNRNFNFDSSAVTSIAITLPMHANFALSQNYPNPFNPCTVIEFALPFPQFVSVMVYDLEGKIVAVLAEGDFSPGTHAIVFNASTLSSGTYFCRLSTSQFEAVRKIVYVR